MSDNPSRQHSTSDPPAGPGTEQGRRAGEQANDVVITASSDHDSNPRLTQSARRGERRQALQRRGTASAPANTDGNNSVDAATSGPGCRPRLEQSAARGAKRHALSRARTRIREDQEPPDA
jgi:hypothetical protein